MLNTRVRKKVQLAIKSVINWLEKLLNKINNEENLALPYYSLSPVNNADIENDYKKSLDWAFDNRKSKDIKNIALTGPYGSGKSSILKTYVTNYKGSDLHFLEISLATFKEEESESNVSKEDQLRLIELSILQQIFYQEEDKRIPDSRFRKIKSFTRRNKSKTTIGFFLVLISIIHLIYPNLLESLLEVNFSKIVCEILHFTALVLIVMAIIHVIYSSIKTISSIKLNKLNIQNAEIGIDDSITKSILNHHIDEILYFFEVTEYNVVIIEDLDRFKQTEIFTKLREINLLINKSRKIKKDVVFVYAVRDDMFVGENERTKFFDFIIPVIPVINVSNSSQKILEAKTLNKYSVSEDLIDSFSLFIDDMRLLNNIINEFYLYHSKLNKNLNQNKLLAIIVYKNLFPNDFTQLNNNKGVLYNTINSKQRYIQGVNSDYDKKIAILKDRIKELEKLKVKDLTELRLMYLPVYLPSLSGFVSFSVDNSAKSPIEMTTDVNFEYLVTNKAHYQYIQSYYQNSNLIPVQFNSIEKQVDSKHTYSERKKQIEDWNNGKTEDLKKEIQEIEKNKDLLRNSTISQILGKGLTEIEITNDKQRNLVSILIRNGFIDENYLDYVSIFYEGSLTKSDHQFLLSVKTKQLWTESP